MKKATNFILFALLLTGSACTDRKDVPAEPVETRAQTAIAETAYYWYDGRKVPLTVEPSRKFVLVDATAEPSLFNADASSDQMFADVSLSPRIVRLAQTRAAEPERKLRWAVLPVWDNTKKH